MSATIDDTRERLQLIRDSAASVVPRDTGAARARALRFQPPGFDRALWTQMCSLGWAGLRVPERHAGSRGGSSEVQRNILAKLVLRLP